MSLCYILVMETHDCAKNKKSFFLPGTVKQVGFASRENVIDQFLLLIQYF